MGMFATIKGKNTCPKCGKRAEWQSKELWLNYKGREIWIGDEHEIELDENINGTITAYCWGKEIGRDGCGAIVEFDISKGELTEIIK